MRQNSIPLYAHANLQLTECPILATFVTHITGLIGDILGSQMHVPFPFMLDMPVGFRFSRCASPTLWNLNIPSLFLYMEGRAADLQLIRLLKAGVINQAQEIKEARQELLFIEASIDAVNLLCALVLIWPVMSC